VCPGLQGAQSHAIWHAWAGMEASQGDVTVVRYLYRRGLEANPRSRFTYLSWGLFEKQQGSLENARALLKQGHQLNPRDPAILQVAQGPLWILVVQTYCYACFVHMLVTHATLCLCCPASWLCHSMFRVNCQCHFSHSKSID